MKVPRAAECRVSVWAPAKINLALEVLARRADGYHDLATIFQTVGLGDRLDLALSPEPGVALTVRPLGLDLGPVEDNLVVRAARYLRQEMAAGGGAPERGAGRSDSGEPRAPARALPGVRIRLTKRIPVGAGLGGGSSDAAATLIGLSHLLRDSGLTPPDLAPIAGRLGADVPFFLEGGTRLGTGVGEILRAFPPFPATPLVLVFPNVGVSTSSVFQQLETGLTVPGPLARMAGLEIPRGFWAADRSDLRNDLQPIVAERHPVVAQLLVEFRRLGSGFARMSGSGSTVFGAAEDRIQAREWVESFRARGFWARVVRPTRGGCRVRRAGGG